MEEDLRGKTTFSLDGLQWKTPSVDPCMLPSLLCGFAVLVDWFVGEANICVSILCYDEKFGFSMDPPFQTMSKFLFFHGSP